MQTDNKILLADHYLHSVNLEIFLVFLLQ